MNKPFQSVGLLSKGTSASVTATLQALIHFFENHAVDYFIEKHSAKGLSVASVRVQTEEQLGQKCELLVVVGGDGSLLHTTPLAVRYQRPLLGINLGQLGFLTDIKPTEIETKLRSVLEGNYHIENRFLVEASLEEPCQEYFPALNEVTITLNGFASMLEFEIYIDNNFLCSQRSDGLIIATPTGSTAYALSAGGPIIHPELDVVVVIPMYPHTLSSRPIVIAGDKKIKIRLMQSALPIQVSCDGLSRCAMTNQKTLLIQKKQQALQLVHPCDYNYFEALRTKLQWGKKLVETKIE